MNIIYWSKLKQSSVFEATSNKKIGIIKDIIICQNEIIGFIILKKSVIYSKRIIINKDDIESIDNLGVYLNNTNNKILTHEGNVTLGKEYINKEVWNEKGEFLGILNDILIDKQKLIISAFYISFGLFEQNNRKIIFAPEEIILKENKIII